MTALPHFPYHRDPVASGSVKEGDAECPCCGKVRGVIYPGVTYSRDRLRSLCPWCIADGSAFKKFGASFFDAYFCDDEGNEIKMEDGFYEEVFGRTIGFATFNPIEWWVHCGRPAEYVRRDEPYDMVFEYHFRNSYGEAALSYLRRAMEEAKSEPTRQEVEMQLRLLEQSFIQKVEQAGRPNVAEPPREFGRQ